MGNKDVVGILKNRLSATIVIERIEASVRNFDTSPSALIELKKAGVPNDVILAMVPGPIELKEFQIRPCSKSALLPAFGEFMF